jgi:DNA-directed RNA polymerase subunit F
MIRSSKAISMTEAQKYLDKEKHSELIGFAKKFVRLSIEEAQKLNEKLENLDLLKVKDSHIAKIIDILPEDKTDLNKIFTDVSLTEDESTKILDAISEFR